MPEGLSLEGGSEPTIESLPTNTEPAAPEPAAEPEPEGVVEVTGRRMVPVETLSAERKRVREATERAIREREIAPLQAKANEADAMRSYLQQVQPHLERLRQHPELLEEPKPQPMEAQISDDEARNEARDLELYDAQGQPDLGRAKRIIARRRTEAIAAGQAAAQAAIGPITSQSAAQASRQNFAQAALSRGADGQQLVDPRVLAQLWAQLPPELTQHAQVRDIVLNAAIGASVRAGKQGPQRPTQAQPFSESPSGQRGATFQHSKFTRDIAQAAGMSEKAFSEGARTYRPGEVNTLGD